MRRVRLALTSTSLVAALLVLPAVGAQAAEPLPTGSYDLVVGAETIQVAVEDDGTATVVGDDDVTVTLGYDDEGRVLDVVRVETVDGLFDVEVAVEDDGSYTQTITAVDDDTDDDPGDDGTAGDEEELAEGDEVDGEHGAIVSTIARCAPRGREAREAGLPAHGTYVRAAAQGLTLIVEVPGVEGEEATVVDGDLSTLAGAEQFCSELDDAVTAVADAIADAEDGDGEDGETDRGTDRAAAKEAREANREAAEDARDEAKAARTAEQAQRKADRDAARRGDDA